MLTDLKMLKGSEDPLRTNNAHPWNVPIGIKHLTMLQYHFQIHFLQMFLQIQKYSQTSRRLDGFLTTQKIYMQKKEYYNFS